jgi:hypothetical protein
MKRKPQQMTEYHDKLVEHDTIIVHNSFDEFMDRLRAFTRQLPYINHRICNVCFNDAAPTEYPAVTELTASTYQRLHESQKVTVILEYSDRLGALYESMHNRLSNLELRLGTATNGL